VIGGTDAQGREPKDRKVSPGEISAMIYGKLGLTESSEECGLKELFV
jgi:hypothetical protein